MWSVEEFCAAYGVDRRNSDCVKWDRAEERFGASGLLPMWVADMDFKIPEAAQKAMIDRVLHGAFGYGGVPASYYEALFGWMSARHGVELDQSWVRFSTGVVNSFFWTVQAFTKPGDAVIVCSPVYYPFYHAVEDNGRLLVCSELVNTEGEYTIDFDDFEAQIQANRVKLFIHCSPHNPVGRVWTEEELVRIFDICTKHGVIVVSDEIHLDFTRPGTEFVSALKLKAYYPNLIVLHSASKTFNLAGLLHSHLIIPDERLREVYDAYAKQVNKAAASVMGIIAAEACYREGREWLDGLRNLIEHNYGLLKSEFEERLPKAVLSEKQGTYLAWLDLRNCVAADRVRALVQDKCGLAVDYGEWFGQRSEGFIRINLATAPEHIRFAAGQISQHFSIS